MRSRFPCHGASSGQALAGVALALSLPQDFQLFPDLMPLAIERALLAFGTVWFINAVNFLDGLDWMTVVQVVPITLGIAILHALGAVPATIGVLALALLGATLGFAIFNKHPAQIFLGDAGSLPIGLCLAFLLIFVAKAHLAAALLLSLYTMADSTLTLFRRILAKERISSAHRTHFYQRGVAAGLSVPQVTARVLLLQILLVGPRDCHGDRPLAGGRPAMRRAWHPRDRARSLRSRQRPLR